MFSNVGRGFFGLLTVVQHKYESKCTRREDGEHEGLKVTNNKSMATHYLLFEVDDEVVFEHNIS